MKENIQLEACSQFLSKSLPITVRSGVVGMQYGAGPIAESLHLDLLVQGRELTGNGMGF